MHELTRFFTLTPGYDCIRQPCGKNGCGSSPGSSHGISSDKWRYAIGDGLVAVSLLVFSGNFPATVPRSRYIDGQVARGVQVDVHTAFPTKRNILRRAGAAAEAGSDCEYVESRRCFGFGCDGEHSTVSFAETFFASHGHGAHDEQPESFWQAFAGLWDRLAGRAYAARVDDKFEQCPRCAGAGTVAKERP